MPHFISYYLKSKVQVLNSLNTQHMVLLLLAQQIWEQEKDNQFLVNSLILLRKVKIKKGSKTWQNNSVYKQEEWEDNIHQWINMVLLIFHQVLDLVSNNHMLLKNFIQVLLTYISLNKTLIRLKELDFQQIVEKNILIVKDMLIGSKLVQDGVI